MRYKVVATTDDTVTLWDGTTKQDPDTPGMATSTYTIGEHGFSTGDKVTLTLRLIE